MKRTHKMFYLFLILSVFVMTPANVSAAEIHPMPSVLVNDGYNLWRIILFAVAFVLFLVILTYSYSIERSFNAINSYLRRNSGDSSKTMIVILFLSIQFLLPTVNAQYVSTMPAVIAAALPADVILLMILVLAGFVTLFVLMSMQKKVLGEHEGIRKEVEQHMAAQGEKPLWKRLVNMLGKDNTEEELKQLDLEHDYDGIRELDNNIPTWWNWAFFGTCLFSFIYFVRFFILGTMPDQVDELKESQRLAEIQIKEYLERTGGGDIDENTVTMQDAAGISEGAVLYAKNCVACHGAAGEGGIGPNLTDEYWLHKGSINDVFYSIKYGWPEQGMISWQGNFSPIEMANLASYVISLQGTNPPNAKEPQGELYTE